MTSAELTEWVAFEQINGPILPHERIDWGFNRLSFYLVSLLGKPKRGREFKFRDFLPPWMKPEREEGQDPRILGAMLESWARADNQ